MQSWILDLVQSLGVLGIGVLMLLENVVPPIPSEIIMPLGGYLSARERMNLWMVIAAGTTGSLLGTLFWYGLGRRSNKERVRAWIDLHGVWLGLCGTDLDRAQQWFERHGAAVVFFGRLLPVIRTLISLPAGFSRMPLPRFLLYSALGTALWTSILALAGRALGSNFSEVDRYVGPVTWAVLAFSLAAYVYRVTRIRQGRRAKAL